MATTEAIVESYRRTKIPPMQQSPRQVAENLVKWSPLPARWTKINVDVVVKAEQEIVGLGIVIKNSDGNVVVAGMKRSIYTGDVPFAEAEAALLGLEVVETNEYNSVIMETESQG